MPTCNITQKQSRNSAKNSKRIKPNPQLRRLHQERDLVGIYSVPHLGLQVGVRMVDIEVDRGMIGDTIPVGVMVLGRVRVRVRVIGTIGV